MRKIVFAAAVLAGVSTAQAQIPNWYEKPKEIAWEYHMNEDDHISIHPYVLHIWRKHNFRMPTPPKVFV
jgi:hypothetical protein